MTVVMLLGIGVGGFVVLNTLKPKPEQAAERPSGLSVFGEQVVKDDLVFAIQAQGEVRPQREILVAPQIAGRIAYVSSDFIDGGFIRKGQVLIRLENADYKLGVVRAQSGVASAEQRLAREQAEAEIAQQDLISLGITDSSPLARREPQLSRGASEPRFSQGAACRRGAFACSYGCYCAIYRPCTRKNRRYRAIRQSRHGAGTCFCH